MDKEDLEGFALDGDTSVECIQIAPMGNGKAAILFVLSDADYVTVVSVIFVVENFDPATAREVLLTSEWLMALSAAPSGELYALEATTWIWRYAGDVWSRDKVSEKSLRQVWAKNAGGPITVGVDGIAYRLEGSVWQPISPIQSVDYLDVHAHPLHGLYVCGDLGAVHRLSATGWQPLELHRHDRFHGIEVAPDGAIRVAGDDGVCLRIANDEVTEIKTAKMTHFAVRSFKGKTYWGNEIGITVEKGDVLEPFEDTEIASDLRTDGSYLYAAGTDTAWRFDSEKWKTLTLVYDDGFRLV
ncbi:MAG: hypothetical protein WCC57_19250 [Paracoccaceae bacterium]